MSHAFPDFEVAWELHKRRVYLVCLKFVRNETIAEDLTSIVFLKAWRARDAFRGDCAFMSWLHRIAVTTCLEHARREKSHPAESLDEMEDRMSDGKSTDYAAAISKRDAELESYADRQTMLAALAMLPPVLRIPLVLREIEGYDHSEISGMLGLTIPVIKSRIYRGNNELRRLLGAPAPIAKPKAQALDNMLAALEKYA